MNHTQNFQAAQTLLQFRERSTAPAFAVVAANGALMTWSTSRKAAYAAADRLSNNGPMYVQKV